MELTALTTLIGSITMMLCYVLVRHRMNLTSGNTYQPSQMAGFFFNMSMFFIMMFIPHLSLANNPGSFPLYMAIGFVAGHAFSYVSLIYMLRMLCSMVPRLNGKTMVVTFAASVFAAILTAINAITMIWGVRPEFDSSAGVMLSHVNEIVSVGIIIFAAISLMPVAILMIINGFRNPHARLRSFLLGGGLMMLIITGPMHNEAQTAIIYAIADIGSSIGFMVVAIGVMYRIEEKISVGKALPAAAT